MWTSGSWLDGTSLVIADLAECQASPLFPISGLNNHIILVGFDVPTAGSCSHKKVGLVGQPCMIYLLVLGAQATRANLKTMSSGLKVAIRKGET